MRHAAARLAVAAGLLAATAALADPAAPKAVRRFAVVVGANAAAPGRAPLRYAAADARALADVLTHTGGFAPADVAVLLDPAPAAVLRALDDALARAAEAQGNALVVFYYSGHADPTALYPAGQRLELAALRTRLADTRANLRVGLIDACRGGGWTGSKGLAPAEPFSIADVAELATRGSVLIASSSGLENAHESEALQGSFFTHHWVAALRGAGDRNGDGRITLGEAFDYAKELTVRDTALVADVPQHPSFHMDVAGRDELVLAAIDRPRATVLVDQQRGPLQLVELGSGRLLLETRPGTRRLRIALPSGKYLVRRRGGDGTWVRELDVASQGATSVDEATLTRVESATLATKSSGEAPLGEAAVVPRQRWQMQLATGVRHAPVIDPGVRVADVSTGGALLVRLARGFGRWHLALPLAAAYVVGDPTGIAVVPWIGVPVIALGSTEVAGTTVQGIVGAGADVRMPVGRHDAVAIGAAWLGSWQWASNDVGRCSTRASPCTPAQPTRRGPSTWTAQLSLGWTHLLADRVTFHLAAAVGADLLTRGAVTEGGTSDPQRNAVVAFGSVQRRGLFSLPLVRVHVDDHLSLDGHVIAAYLPAMQGWQETYLAGFTYLW